MKTQNKILVLVEIAIVLCSLFLVAIPAIAAEQTEEKVNTSEVTTTSEDDYVLGVYGNANEDDTIDMGDVVYTKLAIFGKKPKTELCDAKYDGRINVLDVIQTKLIILGKEKELTVIDGADRIVTVKKPVKRIIPISSHVSEAMRSLKATDKIVGVPSPVASEKVFFAELCDLPNIGGGYGGGYDYEMIVQLQPDLVILYATAYDEVADKIESIVPGVTVVRMSCPYMGCELDVYYDYVRKLGYILDRKDEAEELFDFYEECLSKIEEKVESLSEDEKPRVLFLSWPARYLPTCHTFRCGSGIHNAIVSAGAINIAADLKATPVDPEWVLSQNPEIIIGTSNLVSYAMDNPTEAEMEAERDAVRNQPGWGNLAAVKSDKIYLTGSRLFKTPHHPIGTVYLAKLFHPDLFESLDPAAIQQEYLDRFQGLDYDIEEQGRFVYPPLK